MRKGCAVTDDPDDVVRVATLGMAADPASARCLDMHMGVLWCQGLANAVAARLICATTLLPVGWTAGA
jgi:hypothetical protein